MDESICRVRKTPTRMPSSNRPSLEDSVDGPQGQGHPNRPLQFEVHEVLDPIGHEREHRGRHQGRIGAAGQMPGQDEHPDTGRGNAGEQEDVVDENRVRTRTEPRSSKDALNQRRVGIGQRTGMRIENVAVEQMLRAAREGMFEPLQPPHAQERIAVVGDFRAQIQGLRPREQNRQRDEERGGDDEGTTQYGADLLEQRRKHRSTVPADDRRQREKSPNWYPSVRSIALAPR